ncbi:MAG: fibronectin type III domain-containing protein [Candidatus Aphodosoma sp.]
MKKILIVLAAVVMFWPMAVAQTGPVFTENFERVSTTSGLPVGWKDTPQKEFDNMSKWSLYRGGFASTYCMEWSTRFLGIAPWNILATAEFGSVKGLAVSFDYKNVGGYLAVYVSFDGGLTLEDEPLCRFDVTTDGWEHAVLPLPVSANGKLSLCFAAGNGDAAHPENNSNVKVCIDNVVVDKAPRCARIETMRFARITHDEVDVLWDFSVMGYQSDSVEVMLMLNGDVVRDYALDLGGMRRITVDRLLPNTTYSIRLRTNCEDNYLGKAEWSKELYFQTLCEPHFPINNNFNDWRNVSSCWQTVRSDGKDGLSVSDAFDVSGVGRSIEVTAGNHDDDVFVYTEPVDHEADDLEISFFLYNAGSATGSFEIGLQTDIKSAGTYAKLKDVSVEPGKWTNVVAITKNTPLKEAVNAVVVLVAKGMTSNWYIDNFSVDEIPPCTRPEDIKVTGITDKSITFDWTMYQEADLEVYDEEKGLLGTVSASDKTLDENIMPDTEYNLKFKASCGSPWAFDGIKVRTACVSSQLPLSEDFESTALPGCWLNEGQMVNGVVRKWSTSAARYHGGGRSVTLTHYAPVLDELGENVSSAALVMPYLTVPDDGVRYVVRFYVYRKHSSVAPATLNVYVGTAPFVGYDTRIFSTSSALEDNGMSDGWYKCEVEIPDDIRGDVYVVFEGVSGNGDDLFVDDVAVMKQPSCYEPENLALTSDVTSTSATVAWTSATVPSQWEVVYNYDGLASPVTVMIPGDKSEYVLEGLTENTSYDVDFSVKALCQENDESMVASGRFQFRTDCAVLDVSENPYSENFKSEKYACWTVSGPANLLPVVNSWSNGLNIPKGGWPGRDTVLMVMPHLEYESLSDYRLSFDLSISANTVMVIGVMSDAGMPGSFEGLDTVKGPETGWGATTPMVGRHNISFDYQGDKKYIAFRYVWSNTNTVQSNLDNVLFRKLPPCPDAYLDFHDITANSVSVSVTCSEEALFDIEYGVAGFSRGEGISLNGQSASFDLGNLIPNTEYEVYIRSVCADGGEGVWNVYGFSTLCESYVVTEENPFFDGFEGKFACWTVETVSGTGGWRRNINAADMAAGRDSATMVLDRNCESCLLYPVILSQGKKYQFELDVRPCNNAVLEISYCSGNDVVYVASDRFDMDVTVREPYIHKVYSVVPITDASHIRIKVTTPQWTSKEFELDNVGIAESLCEYVNITKVVADMITDSSALISWVSVGADSYQLLVSDTETDPEGNETMPVKTVSGGNTQGVKVDGLAPNTLYYLYIRSLCGTGENTKYGTWTIEPFLFRTGCEAKTFPFVENFDDPEVYDCWRLDGDGSGRIACATDNRFSGDASAKITTGANGVVVITSPEMQIEDGRLDNKMLTFRAYTADKDVNLMVLAGKGDDVYEVETSLLLTRNDGWKEFTVYFAGLADDEAANRAANISIVAAITSGGSFYIDDFVVGNLSACPKPTGVTVSDIENDKVLLTWSSVNENAVCNIKVKSSDGEEKIYPGVLSPYAITGLQAQTFYTAGISSVCDDGESDAAEISFTTDCGVASFPFKENFDNMIQGDLTECWIDNIKTGSNDVNNKWTIGRESVNGTNSLMFESSSNWTGNTCMVQTPVIDLTDIGKAYLSFRMSAPGNAKMDVLVSTDGAETFDIVLHEGIVSPDWNVFVYELADSIVGRHISIGFRGTSNRGRANLYVDDIEVVASVGCPQPAGITASALYSDSVELTVSSMTGSKWHVAVLESGAEFADDYAGYATFDSKVGVVRGLNQGMRYEVYVRNVCGDGQYSRWLGPVYFETPCGVQPVGYTEDFESYGSKADLKCIVAVTGNGIGNYPPNTNFEITDDSSVAIDGKSCKLTDGFTAGGIWLVLPEIDGDIERLQLSYSVNTDRDKKEVVVYLLSDDDMKWDPAAGKIAVRNVHANGISDGEAYFDGTALTGKGYRIAVWTDRLVTAAGDNEIFAIDNISVNHIPPFFTPHGIGVSDISHQSASVSWIRNDEAVASQIMVVCQDSETLVDVEGNDNSCLLDNLLAETEYTIRVRDIRGSDNGDTTRWSSPFVFTTNKLPATVPYSCGFEDDNENGNWSFSGNGGSVSWGISMKDPQGKGVYDGEKAMYVAEYGMHTYSFGFSKRMMCAKRSFRLAHSAYKVNFTYHSDGHTSYAGDADYLKLVLVPAGKSVEDPGAVNITGTLKGQSDWTGFEGYFTPSADGYYDLVFVWNCDAVGFGNTGNIPGAVDNIVISNAGCVPVLDLEIDSVRAESALVTWTDNNVDGHLVEYVLLPGDSEFDENTADIVAEVQDSIRLTRLEPDKSYGIFMRMVCGENYTDWVSKSFSTPCRPVAVDVGNFVTDDFEDYDGEQLYCWHHADNNTARWTNAAPDVIPYSGDKSIVIRGNSDAMIYRQFVLTAGFNYQVLFYAKQSLSQNTGTSVDVLIGGEFDDAEDFRSVSYAQPVTKNEWTLFTYRFSVDSDGVYNVGIKGTARGNTHYLSVDSVVICAVACDQPVNLQAMITPGFEQVFWSGGTAPFDVAITSNGVEVAHQRIAGRYFMIGDMIGTPLPGAARYTVSVRSVCAEDRISDAAEITFVTPCNGAVSAPYFEDFELSDKLPPCWQVEKTNGIAYPWSVYEDADGNSVMKFESGDNTIGAVDRLFSPGINVAENGWSLSVDYINPAGGALSVYLSEDGGATYSDTLLDEVIGVGTWQTLSVALDSYVGENVVLVAEGVSNYSLDDGAYIWIDNFRVSKIAGHKEMRDTACHESGYRAYGFELPVGVLDYGDNILTRLAYGDGGAPDTLISVSVWVPNSDFYITDMFVENEKPYNKNGFENVMSAEYELTKTVKSELCGCDSTIHLTLIPMVLEVEVYDTICEVDLPYMFCTGGEDMELTESDTYSCTVPNDYGRDSVTILHLTVLPSVVERFDTICDGDFADFGGLEYTVSGTYEADSIYAFGCGYKSILHLNVVPLEIRKDTAVCQGRYVEVGGERYNTTGTHIIPLPSIGGCYREMILNLTVTSAGSATLYTYVCEDSPVYYPGFEGMAVSGDTVLFRTDKTVGGCDSVTELVVDFIPAKHVYDTVMTEEKVYVYNGRTLTVSGDYYEKLQSNDEYACDSIHHLHIEFADRSGVNTVNVKGLEVVPNPVAIGGTAYIYGGWTDADIDAGLTFEIMDVAGNKVCGGRITGLPMPIDGLSVNGVYIIRITDNNGSVSIERLMVR